ncbi:MAG: Pyridoxamine 5-phosphate oxidase-related protein [Pelosinus sp.]|nr:Pyridoxamine 5-phosphate oxidase-related protein [Pelosinus sp.]
MPQKQLSIDEAIDFITHERVGHLATYDLGNFPYITPLNYMYYQGKIYFHCGNEGRKLNNIKANNQVCFEVSRINKSVFGAVACQCSTRYTSALVFGVASIIEDIATKVDLLTIFTECFAEGRPFPPIHAEAASRVTVVEITIASIEGKCNVDPEKL